MTLTNVSKDRDAATMTVTAEFDADVERVWQLWADPRKLERWWGPPTYPATVLDHDLTPGGKVTYVMTGPEGEKHGGYWNVVTVDAPRAFEVEDGFLGEDGQPNDDLPTMRMRVELAARPGGGTTANIVSTFPSAEAMDKLVEMGMEEGMRESMGQMDAVLAA
jgi:uncharacterized protein YndB with AHSA1/START domain